MDLSVVTKKVADCVSPIIEMKGYRLVDVDMVNEFGRRTLRVLIEHCEHDIKVADCEEISRSIGDIIEVEAGIDGQYNLEVSSPGLDRPLKTAQDFERFKGRSATIKTKEPLGGRGKFKGELMGMEGTNVVVSIDGDLYRVPLDTIKKANLEIEF